MLSVAVLSILITAPLGATGFDLKITVAKGNSGRAGGSTHSRGYTERIEKTDGHPSVFVLCNNLITIL